MSSASARLARFAAELSFEQLPGDVVACTKDYLADTIGAAIFGAELPWSRMVFSYARDNGASGRASVLGRADRMRASSAALVNGAYGHAFELDCLIQPGLVIHHGVSVGIPALAAAQECGRSGRELIAAVVAGTEVMCRIADAATRASAALSYHTPALIGVFGGAIAAGKSMGLSTDQLAHALGIGGSLCSGLVEFSNTGGMVKRMHLGRAAEGSILAASLARAGYTGPAEVLEGKFGYLKAYCRDAEPERLTSALGERWFSLETTLKRYSCHSTCQVPVALALQLRSQHRFSGDDVVRITIAGGEKMVAQHAIYAPQDLTMAQYSAPFCTALALYEDVSDPRAFSDAKLEHEGVRALARGAQIERRPTQPGDTALASTLTVTLKDGRKLSADARSYRGMAGEPLARAELGEKFLKLVAHRDRSKAQRLFARLGELERVEDCADLDFAL